MVSVYVQMGRVVFLRRCEKNVCTKPSNRKCASLYRQLFGEGLN